MTKEGGGVLVQTTASLDKTRNSTSQSIHCMAPSKLYMPDVDSVVQILDRMEDSYCVSFIKNQHITCSTVYLATFVLCSDTSRCCFAEVLMLIWHKRRVWNSSTEDRRSPTLQFNRNVQALRLHAATNQGKIFQ